MGIKGLWQALREYVDDGHLSQFRGQRVAVDMYVWLHRCIHRCVRINTDVVLTYLDAKYASNNSSSSSGRSGAVLEPLHHTSSLAHADASDSGCGVPLPLLDDVLVIDDLFITQVLEKVSALQRFGVTPVCVFDGKEMPMKGGTDGERQRRRTEAFEEAMRRLEQLYCDERRRMKEWPASGPRAGQRGSHTDGADSAGSTLTAPQQQGRVVLPRSSPLYEEAVQLMEKAVDISTELAHAIIQILREERSVECIVAPYEADAQLAYLCREGYVAAAASEDSDLIAYYCPCVISKLDTYTGKCEVLQPPLCAPQFYRVIAASAISASHSTAGATSSASSSSAAAAAAGAHGGRGSGAHARLRAAAVAALPGSPQSPHGIGLDGKAGEPAKASTHFTYESFLLGCIMAGCDYVANLRSIGIKKAFKLVATASSLRQVFQILETDYGFPADDLARYRRGLLEAFYCFAHHLVYCPLRQEIVTYRPLPASPSGGRGSAEGGEPGGTLKTHLVGDKWDAQTAQDVCARCLNDPCTLRLYRGIYQSCVTRYLQRTRRGQTSLTAYAGFEEMQPSRVVVQLGSARGGDAAVKRERVDGIAVARADGTCVDREGPDFGGPLKKQKTASGFLGTAGDRGADVVVVRSRYFLMHGRTAVCERWSGSSDEDSQPAHNADSERATAAVSSARAGESAAAPPGATQPSQHLLQRAAPRTHHLLGLARPRTPMAATTGAETLPARDAVVPASPAADACSNTSSDTSDDGAERAPMAADGSTDMTASAAESCASAAAPPPVPQSLQAETPDVEPYAYPIAAESSSPQETRDVPATAAASGGAEGVSVSVAPAPAPLCACPFGYWQCNRPHSVFESCFLGRQWSREVGPAQSAAPPIAVAHPPGGASSPTLANDSASNATSRGSAAESPVSAGGSGYAPRGFRPPRSTAFPAAPCATRCSTTAAGAAPPSPHCGEGTAEEEEVEGRDAEGPASAPLLLTSRSLNGDGVGERVRRRPPLTDCVAASAAVPLPRGSEPAPLLSSSPPPQQQAAGSASLTIFDAMSFKKSKQ